VTAATSSRRLLAVFAHPDDEAYGVAGLLTRLGADPAASAALFCLTRGEASSMGPARGLSPTEVAALRTERLHRVAEITALDRLVVGDLPDGGLARQPLPDVAAEVRRVLDDFEPQVVVTHCARGVNGHPDHVAAHWAVRRALEDRPGVRLAMVAYRQEACEAVRPRLLFPTKDAEIDVTLVLDERERAAKEACLRVHEAVASIDPEYASERGLLLRPAVEELDVLGTDLSPPTDDVFYGLSASR
jgi:LmbE family N-acetylglucosaminyl deacetylase